MYTGFRGRYTNFRKGLNMMVNEELLKLITGRVIDKITKYNAFKIPVGVSNRHVHVTSEDLETLFGKGYQLTKKSDLKQPGQYACNETVTIRGPKGEFERVRILGPVRKQSQIEISKTDSFRLGVKALIRESGVGGSDRNARTGNGGTQGHGLAAPGSDCSAPPYPYDAAAGGGHGRMG